MDFRGEFFVFFLYNWYNPKFKYMYTLIRTKRNKHENMNKQKHVIMHIVLQSK